MANKPKIQYVGQFYVYGSEAKKVAQEEPRKVRKGYLPPLPDLNQERVIRLEPVAVVGIVMAMVLFVSIVTGALGIQSAWQEFRVAKNHLEQVQSQHHQVEARYEESYSLSDIKAVAENMGLVPVSQVKHITLLVTMPEPEPVRTLWEDVCWFVEGMFAGA